MEAQYNLGVCYFNGDGVEVDKTEAMKWFRRAADKGYKDAIYALRKIDNSSSSSGSGQKNFCSQCGGRVKPEDRFCSGCGTKL